MPISLVAIGLFLDLRGAWKDHTVILAMVVIAPNFFKLVESTDTVGMFLISVEAFSFFFYNTRDS